MNRKSILLTAAIITSLIFLVGCGPAKSIEEKFSEEEFVQEEFFCQDNDLSVDFKPGLLVCSGVIDEEAIVLELVPAISGGAGYFQIIRYSIEGETMPGTLFADVNVSLAQETYLPEDGYEMTSIIITDDDLTITSTLLEQPE